MGGGSSRRSPPSGQVERTALPVIQFQAVVSSSSVANSTDRVQSPPQTESLAIIPTLSTPRRVPGSLLSSFFTETSMEGVSQTPSVAAEKEIFRIYCPLCMGWFREGLLTKCCGNQICRGCLIEYLAGFGYSVNEGRVVASDSAGSKQRSIFCPHCQSEDTFAIGNIDNDTKLRNYADTPMANRGGAAQPRFEFPSPVRVGASFDELQRKLRPFNSTLAETDGTFERRVATEFVAEILKIHCFCKITSH